MEHYNSHLPRARAAAGFALPAVLIITGALLILAVGSLMVVGIERSTARSFVDRNRADLAVQAGLEDIRALFNAETSNDDFLVMEALRPDPTDPNADPVAPYLFIARGERAGNGVKYRHVPLFSNKINSATNKIESSTLIEQAVDAKFIGPDLEAARFITQPYFDDAKVAWLPVLDSQGKVTARYAYWVEDLQSRLEAKTAGNVKDGNSAHKRFGWTEGDASASARFPAPGINPDPSDIGPDGRDKNPPLDPIAAYLITTGAGPKDDPNLEGAFNSDLVGNRLALVSPNSVLAAAKIPPPLTRDKLGRLTDEKARGLEENFVSSVMPYEEQPTVPFSTAFAAAVIGQPKLNLNAMLAMPKPQAVDSMAEWIDKALPLFKERKGGFPDDYLKTLAAGALDYADEDSDGTASSSLMGSNSYRGLDAYPLMSEIVLHMNYQGVVEKDGRKYLKWQFILFVELWNPTNIKVEGNAQFSYENRGTISAIGAGTGIRFDDPDLLDDPIQATHYLLKGPDYYWFPQRNNVELEPNEYRFYANVAVDYEIDVGSVGTTLQNTFTVTEPLGASGISMKWNGVEVDRNDKLVRQGVSGTDYITNFKREEGKANIPGHSYGTYNTNGNYKNNMGDPRQALYLRDPAFPLSDNAYPDNVSPNRRNIRNASIYRGGIGQDLVYGRILPAEWPDGGHNVPVLSIPSSSDPKGYNPASYARVLNSKEGHAPTFLSNRGRFFSASELGRIFDPIMFQPKYERNADTNAILSGRMPSSQTSWPSVEQNTPPSPFYGGGNTLRIGRPEHPNFSKPATHLPNLMPQNHAARLLDLFHAGKSRSENRSDREGNTVRIEGHININTAGKDILRALAGGNIEMDPRLSRRSSDKHQASTMAPPVSDFTVSAPTREKEADLVAEAIIRGRPYHSASELAAALDDQGRPVFGNKELLPSNRRINWSDAAAEELFARVYNSSTVRSRNFRIWIVGQSVSPTELPASNPEVLSEVRRSFTVFADPGERNADGTIDPTKTKLTIINENDF